MKARHLCAVCALAALTASAKFDYSRAVTDAEKDDGRPPISSVWQKRNAATLEAAVDRDAIAAFVASPETAQALLSEVKGAYASDPASLYQIAEVTHRVMEGAGRPWWNPFGPDRDGERRLWTNALLARAGGTADEYVKIFCLDQLRWCGYADQVEDVLRLGARAGSPRVEAFARQVARELN